MGWGVRVEFLKAQLEASGHQCVVLNIGDSRAIDSTEYETVKSAIDYVRKLARYARRGHLFHVHVNGSTHKGLIVALVAELVALAHGCTRALTFHAGIRQAFFPRSRSGALTPLFQLVFGLAHKVICNSAAVKERIIDYGVRPDKVVPIPAFTRQYLEHQWVALSPRLEDFLARHSPILLCYVKFRAVFHLDVLFPALGLLRQSLPDMGVILVGTTSEDADIERAARASIAREDLEAHLCEVPDLTHDEFRTLMRRSALYLRTPTTDGVCSSVLEALSFGVPVVAAANGTRPPSVVTYEGTNAREMVDKVTMVVNDLQTYREAIVKPPISDTLSDEATLLINLAAPAMAGSPR